MRFIFNTTITRSLVVAVVALSLGVATVPAQAARADIIDTQAFETGIPNLSVLTAGQALDNPAELLSGIGFAQLMQEARKHFRRVVIDSAPVHAASDTLLLVQHVQAVCLVVDSRKTPREAALRAIHVLQEAGASMAGIVLNRLPIQSGKSCYYHYGTGPYGDSAYNATKAVPEKSG